MSDPTSPREHNASAEKTFAPKTKVDLQPPKDDPITYDELAQCDGTKQPPAACQSRDQWGRKQLTLGVSD